MNASLKAATAFLIGLEGLSFLPYNDVGGVKTVCFGETENVENREYTLEECNLRLGNRVELLNAQLNREYAFFHTLTDNQRAALISFIYNIGEQAFRKSAARRMADAGRPRCVADEMMRWVYVKGKFSQGLYNRRKQETELWLRENN